MKNYTKIIFLIFILNIFMHQAKAQEESSAICVEPSGANFVGNKSRNLDSVIIFVHGLGGNSVDTWTEGFIFKNYWPCLIKMDKIFSESNVFVYDYPTSVLSGKTSIDNIASRLFIDLSAADIFKYKHISIVAHSLGGLVVSRMLLQLEGSKIREHSTALSKIRQIFFYGVPASGNGLAALAKVFGSSQQVIELADHEFNNRILDRWLSVKWNFSVTCLSETEGEGVPLFKYIVVPDSDVFRYCGNKKDKFYLDGYSHTSMVKPSGINSDPYKRLSVNYLLCVRPMIVRSTYKINKELKLKLNDWYDEFILELNKNEYSVDKITKLINLPTPGAGFLLPAFGKIGVDNNSFEIRRGANIINTEIFNQLRPRLISGGASARILSIFNFSEINNIVHDLSINDLKSSIEINFNDDGNIFAVVAGSDEVHSEKVLMIFNYDVIKNNIVFKGFVFMQSNETCTDVGAASGF